MPCNGFVVDFVATILVELIRIPAMDPTIPHLMQSLHTFPIMRIMKKKTCTKRPNAFAITASATCSRNRNNLIYIFASYIRSQPLKTAFH